ncbi:hypothetical protein CWI76_04745 [Pseudidiomarina marina]|uniref:DUF4381 domain-containing protein n=2 Tax=Pseudidiomarina marina TaxID=502366 RepID=A0A432YKU3_9GAMM|nr:hypothetical protein CWI76_04745 [Pseudidiomarina marina]
MATAWLSIAYDQFGRCARKPMARRVIMILLDKPIEMNDIVAAPAASWWPLAIGWYILAAVTLVTVISAMVLSVRAYRKRRPRRLALRQLRQQPPETLSAITLLLKQATLAYVPHHNTLNWWDFLSEQLSSRQRRRYQPLLASLSEASYQPHVAQQQWVEPYRDFAVVWLKQALPLSTKQTKEQGDD